MISELLEEQAALYAAGALTAEERGHFELILEYNTELRELVRELHEGAVALVVPASGIAHRPSAAVKTRVLAGIAGQSRRARHPAFVMSDPEGLVQWVNPAFTEMCGYSLEELQGRKLGPILQGELTDHAAAARMRDAIHTEGACSEQLINYHKDGRPYWVAIEITPIRNAGGDLLCFIAQERELVDRPIAA
jgi:PAS domain S-box-containing protein